MAEHTGLIETLGDLRAQVGQLRASIWPHIQEREVVEIDTLLSVVESTTEQLRAHHLALRLQQTGNRLA